MRNPAKFLVVRLTKMSTTKAAAVSFLACCFMLLDFGNVACAAFTSPRFVVKHRSSGYCYDYVDWWAFNHHYEKFRAEDCNKADEVEWVQVQGHLGHLRVVGSGGHCLNPFGGWMEPGDNTALFPYPKCQNAALFSIDQENGRIQHVGGKYVSSWPFNNESPRHQSDLIVHSGTNLNNQFDFLKKSDLRTRVTVIPSPTVIGSWEKVTCWYGVHKGTLSYKITIGTSKKSSTSLTNSWELSVNVAKGIVSASATYSGSFTTAYESEWKTESTIDRSITIDKDGGDICLWQWMYSFRQFGDSFTFRSFTIRETRNDKRPTEIPRSKK